MVRAEKPSEDRTLPLPEIDERLIWPETRYEVVDGEVCYVSPAEPPHAILHARLAALLEAHAAEGFETAVDMLTRTSHRGDMAPDGSVFPEALDPETGGRQIEQLAFEIVSSESIAHAGRKALALTGRGVRRVFAVDVEKSRVLEWSRDTGAWQLLASGAAIADAALVLPLPVGALLDAAEADDAVSRAMLAKKNPVLTRAVAEGEARGRAAGEARGRAEGEARGRAEAIVAVLAARGLTPTAAQLELLHATSDGATLATWLARAVVAARVDAVFGGDEG